MRVRKQLQALETIEIPDILDHRPVAIEEHGSAGSRVVSWRSRRTASYTRSVEIRFMQR